MPQIELRTVAGTRGPDDIVVTVQDKTFDYLMSSNAPTIRVSSYLDQDYPLLGAKYAELFVHENCAFESLITDVIPGSRERKGLVLPCEMLTGEQLTILVARTEKNPKVSAEI